jgi:glycosyltransferase involved in cell wall biosynthesis
MPGRTLAVATLDPLGRCRPRFAPATPDPQGKDRYRALLFATSDLLAGPIAKLSGAKLLISSRRDMGILRRPHHSVAYRLLHRIYDQVHAVSERVRQYSIQADGLDSARTVTIYNGVDIDVRPDPCEVEHLRRDFDLPPGATVVVSVANFRHIKGIDVLVKAAAVVCRTHASVQFLVAGSLPVGEQHPGRAYWLKIQELVREYGMENRVRFVGFCENIPAFLQLADLFVLPSRSEGFSNALVEAMNASLPCIATAVGGNTEIIENGVNGGLVPPDDPDALADRIVSFLADAPMRQRLGLAGRKRVAERFTTQNMVSQVVKSYSSLLATNTAHGRARDLTCT